MSGAFLNFTLILYFMTRTLQAQGGGIVCADMLNMLRAYMHILEARKSGRFGKILSALTIDQDLVKLVICLGITCISCK